MTLRWLITLLALLAAEPQPTLTSDSRLQVVIPERYGALSGVEAEKLSPGLKYANVLAVRDRWNEQTLAIFTIDSAASEARSLDDFVKREQRIRSDRGERDPEPRRSTLPTGLSVFQLVSQKREGDNALNYVITYVELPKAYATVIFTCPTATAGAGQRDLTDILSTLSLPVPGAVVRRVGDADANLKTWTTKDQVVQVALDDSWRQGKEPPGNRNALFVANDNAQVMLSLSGGSRAATKLDLGEAAKRYRELYMKSAAQAQTSELKETTMGGRRTFAFDMNGKVGEQQVKWQFAIFETQKAIAIAYMFGPPERVDAAQETFGNVVAAVRDYESTSGPATKPASR